MSQFLVEQFERLIRRDPARRGLIGDVKTAAPLCSGHLYQATQHLAQHGKRVGILTGFFVPHGTPSAAETDGPPGAALLANALEQVGIETWLLTDTLCAGAVRAAAQISGCVSDRVLVAPHNSCSWRKDFFRNGPGKHLTHLIAVERPGPSHTPQSLLKQIRKETPPLQRFKRLIPQENFGCCYNMHGQKIDQYVGDLHCLFEELHQYRLGVKTIGIGDGGNEIGMGSIPWEILCQRLGEKHAARIPCRIATHWNIIAGTSNWGALALAATLLLFHNQVDKLRSWNASFQEQFLRDIIEKGPAVDGVTGLQEATVDALPFLTYIQPWVGIRRLLNLDD